jgi:hypothetical protein
MSGRPFSRLFSFSKIDDELLSISSTALMRASSALHEKRVSETRSACQSESERQNGYCILHICQWSANPRPEHSRPKLRLGVIQYPDKRPFFVPIRLILINFSKNRITRFDTGILDEADGGTNKLLSVFVLRSMDDLSKNLPKKEVRRSDDARPNEVRYLMVCASEIITFLGKSMALAKSFPVKLRRRFDFGAGTGAQK